jgi:bifunctional UDP-N-acetylglucosamine pyrophosphorylase/glucosamine-1-phosphate N-acetyltransferase
MTSTRNIHAVVLAAGKGTRMKSAKAKVLHEVFFKPMVHHVLDSIHSTGIKNCSVILGHQHQKVAESIRSYDISIVLQEEQLGTGHAVLCAENACGASDTVMILCGDTPLIRPETLTDMISQHQNNKAVLTLMSTILADPFGYGRIICNQDGNITEIVEQKDASEQQRTIQEINAGIYLVDREFLFKALKQVGTDNVQGEVYLTDIVGIANRLGYTTHKFIHPAAIDVLGVNSRIELNQAHQELQKRRNQELMLAGVTIYCQNTVFIAPEVTIEQDTVIYPAVQITGQSKIGRECILESGVQIDTCIIGSNSIVGSQSCLSHCTIGNTQKIDPLTYRIK